MKDRISTRYRDRKANLEEIRRQVWEAWNAIGEETLEDLITTMPQRCQDVIAANGMYTKW